MGKKRPSHQNQDSTTAAIMAMMSPLVYVMAYAIVHLLR
jgi:hypothetical protein